jgi:adenosylhomocysteine nucleosidase
MIVAIGSMQREAIGIIRSGSYTPVEAPEDFIAHQPGFENFPVIVLSGSGIERSARATKWAIERFEPEAIISFGFCSATKDFARSGDIVIAARVAHLPGTPFEWSMAESTSSFGPDRTSLLAARTAVEVTGLDYHHGTLVTLSKIPTTPGTKTWLGEAIDATAVDTEAHAVASVASEAGIPWAAVSSVLDDRDFETPKIADRIGSGPNERGITAYIKHISNKPFDLPALMRLGRSSTRASASLTTFMAAFMEAHATLSTRVEQTADSE